MPGVAGGSGTFPDVATAEPRIFGALSGQSDVPATIAAASIGNGGSGPYIVMLP